MGERGESRIPEFPPPTPVSGLCLVVVYDTGTEMAARMILKKTFPELPAGYCCKQ